ncbi:MAG: ribonuclease P [Methanomicrobiales archaeon]|nr:ribonuclease P [Methanomicrobiales archaeon]
MRSADATVHPYPAGDSSLRRMAQEARDLGYDTIAVADVPCQPCPGIEVISAEIIREQTVRGVIASLRRVGQAGSRIVLVNGGDTAFNRAVTGLRGVHALRHVHKMAPYSFDPVCARLAAVRGVAVDLDIRPLTRYRGGARQHVIRRYADLLMLHDQYNFPLTISTNARSVLEQRSPRELAALCAVFGMTSIQVREALGTLSLIIEDRRGGG